MLKIRLKAIIVVVYLYSASIYAQTERDFQLVTLAFYNLENLFDTENDPITFDDDRTPEGKDRWTLAIYRDKLAKMAEVIIQIGPDNSKMPPVLLGVSEIENRKVLEDLVSQSSLLPWDYGIVHYDSPDRRGIDTGLLYQKKYFQLISSSAHELLLYDPENNNKRIYTRDQLLVTGLLAGEKVHIIVNHWPSRSGGEARSQPRREAAAFLNKKIIDSIHAKEPYAKIITMGDLNDDPKNNSVKSILGAKGKFRKLAINELYNPMESFAKKGLGTLAYRDGWNLFDQIIISAALLSKDYKTFQFYKAGIFNKRFLQTPSGPYKGYPFRSFANGSYTGGYSDHFPVYVSLIREYAN
ncbi:endonuclease/exonuclease/phosphatase family protein [Leeuwenhoekiella sp. NPDC079379]|uniref:endonuclease/exonuclease/phosphatase family protein n=1 Tax=Leeuwenhoekiella sp. NPDC079379 TaxID=3364122 RepID=UPI0037C642B2